MGDGSSAPQLRPEVYSRIRDAVRRHAGIELGERKLQLCQTRLLRRLRALELDTFEDYIERIDEPSERHELINAITTNVTAFFREPHHFDRLARTILPAFAADPKRTRLRVWSAGCSSGEEAWSLAMTLDEAALPARWDVRILATDIDTAVVGHATEGVYTEERVAPISEARRTRYLVRGNGPREGLWRVKSELRDRVAFRTLNLFEPWPMRQPFDVIFCRNVVIYFDAVRKNELLRRFRDALAPGGYLVLGHSESLLQPIDGLESAGPTMYRRRGVP